MHQITVQRVFSAAHAIRLYDGTHEPLHGHDWRVEVTVEAEALDAIDVVMDFHALEAALESLLSTVRNRNLNEVEPFVDRTGEAGGAVHGLAINPTAERVAQWLGESIAATLPAGVRLSHVGVGEAPGCIATYRP